MKKRGFTLVELLAVLVLIAAISLIIFPSIINYINGSKNDISDTSKGLIYESTKLYIDNNKNSFPEVAGNTYCVTVGELIDNDYLESTFKDAVSGKTIDRNKKIKVSFEYDNDLKINKFKYDLDDSCEAKTILCQANTEKVSALVYNSMMPTDVSSYTKKEVGLLASESGKYTLGVSYTCELGDGEEKIFYVLEESGDNISLIMSRNLINSVNWCDFNTCGNSDSGSCDNNKGPVTALNHLKENTKSWSKLKENQITLPTYDQIYQAAGNKLTNLPTWLNSYTDDNVSSGYWTSTKVVGNNNSVYSISVSGNNGIEIITDNSCWPNEFEGVRPVITISKSQLG